MARTLNNLTGQVFGRLTAISRTPNTKLTTWACLCTCGKVKNVLAGNLTTGRSTSCGCSKYAAPLGNPVAESRAPSMTTVATTVEETLTTFVITITTTTVTTITKENYHGKNA